MSFDILRWTSLRLARSRDLLLDSIGLRFSSDGGYCSIFFDTSGVSGDVGDLGPCIKIAAPAGGSSRAISGGGRLPDPTAISISSVKPVVPVMPVDSLWPGPFFLNRLYEYHGAPGDLGVLFLDPRLTKKVRKAVTDTTVTASVNSTNWK